MKRIWEWIKNNPNRAMFLVPILLVAVYFSEGFTTKKVLLTALTFSWIGDVVLLFASKGEIYFILGLVAFLISHVFYIVVKRFFYF